MIDGSITLFNRWMYCATKAASSDLSCVKAGVHTVLQKSIHTNTCKKTRCITQEVRK